MAGSAPARPRRGPAPIASFDHDNSDESSPESKAAARLPEIREQLADDAGPAEARARAASAPGLSAAPRIDISRASSSSHQDSRDSSPELALFEASDAAGGDAPATLGFREDGALDLRSSTEELSFLEPAAGPTPPAPAPPAPSAPPAPPAPRRHSRKDSQSSEAALLAVSGRTSRLSSVGSACSAASALSHVSRLSVVSGVSRSPSPHKMLLETSFCGPRPLEAEPELSASELSEAGRLLALGALDHRDRRHVRTEVTVEPPRPTPPPPAATVPATVPALVAPVKAVSPAPLPTPPITVAVVEPQDDKKQKENQNRARVEERRSRPRLRREPSEPEVYRSANRSKDIVRIRLKPKEEYDDDDVEEEPPPKPTQPAVQRDPRKPATLELRAASPRRSPSPGPASRKSSFCSLFKSRETIASPESPLRRKRSLTETRARSRSRERSATPTSARLRGSVLALFRAPRRASAPRPASPRVEPPAPPAAVPPPPGCTLKYYEEANNGIIHIPLRTPPEEAPGSPRPPRPASAPQPRATSTSRPTTRTVLPDGSIIIPLHSPTERAPPAALESPPAPATSSLSPSSTATPIPEPSPVHSPVVSSAGVRTPTSHASTTTPASSSVVVTPLSPPSTTPAGTARSPSPDRSPAPAAPPDAHRGRRERIVFTTHVGSAEQVFSTQLSITKTPSVTSEISATFSLGEGALRDTRIGATPSPPSAAAQPAADPGESSGSEASSEAGERSGSEAEKRGLVVQESFEELPYVPTTLPQERPLALPMVPVRERGGVRVAGLQRPRGAPSVRPAPLPAPAPPVPAAPPAQPAPPAADKLHIHLPRRPRPASAPDRPERRRTIAGATGGGVATGAAGAARSEWVEFAEGAERRRAARRIQTLPARSYVPPEDCRCRCHNHHNQSTSNGSSPECEAESGQELSSTSADQTHGVGRH